MTVRTSLENELHLAVKRAFDQIVIDVSKDATELLNKKIRAEADKIALGMLKHYDMQMIGDQITITVKKEI